MKERTPVLNPGLMAIRTRYVGPTDETGSLIVAEVSGTPINHTVAYDHALDSPGNHAAAAVALVNHMKSEGRWAEDICLTQGALDDGYVFIMFWEDPR